MLYDVKLTRHISCMARFFAPTMAHIYASRCSFLPTVLSGKSRGLMVWYILIIEACLSALGYRYNVPSLHSWNYQRFLASSWSVSSCLIPPKAHMLSPSLYLLDLSSSCLIPLSASAEFTHFLMRHDAWSCAVCFTDHPLFCLRCYQAKGDDINDPDSREFHIASYIPFKHQKRSKNTSKMMKKHFVIHGSKLTR